MYMFMNYLRIGISYLVISIPIAIILLLVYHGMKFLIVKRFNVTISKILCQMAWITIIISILGITGVISGDYTVTSLFQGTSQFNFRIFDQGINNATILNLVLFIPYGFLAPIIFEKIDKKRIYGVLIGLVFTLIIEFLQSFTGRFVELEDILMNTLGTYIGYSIAIALIRYKIKKANQCV